MDNLIYVLFICIVAPLTMMLFLLTGKSKQLVGFMLAGICISLFISELNTVLLRFFSDSVAYVTTTITPISEEIVKAVPVLVYVFLCSDDRNRLLPISFAVGIGFAMFENVVILVQNIENVSIGWAVIRGVSTALMHGVCTMSVGYGMSFIRKKKKLFICGTFALLSLAVIYHGIFNMLVQSDTRALGLALPAVTFIPLLLRQKKYQRKTKRDKPKG